MSDVFVWRPLLAYYFFESDSTCWLLATLYCVIYVINVSMVRALDEQQMEINSAKKESVAEMPNTSIIIQ